MVPEGLLGLPDGVLDGTWWSLALRSIPESFVALGQYLVILDKLFNTPTPNPQTITQCIGKY